MNKPRGGLYLFIMGLAIGGLCATTARAEAPTNKTTVQFDLSVAKSLRLSSGIKENPPTIVLNFKSNQVEASFPELSQLNSPIISTIKTNYAESPRPGQSAAIDSIEIVMTEAFKHRVWTEQGKVYVEIHHPDLAAAGGVSRAQGLVISGERVQFDQRFKAMQEALSRARGAGEAVSNVAAADSATPAAALPVQTAVNTAAASAPLQSPIESVVEPYPGPNPGVGKPTQIPPEKITISQMPKEFYSEQERNQMLLYAGLLLLLLGLSVANRRRKARPHTQLLRNEKAVLGGFGNRFLSELVWQAFERQGYQLISEIELSDTGDVLRVIVKDGVKAGLMCLSSGVFYERQIIQRYVKALNEVRLKQGFLVATGSFTVPAQRLAKENNVQLIGRAQLIELLSIGATSEYVTRQLEKSAEELKQTKQTLAVYAQELDTLRRQRNEASWYLGGERVKTTKLQAQLDDLNGQLMNYEQEVGRWQEEVRTLQKQWEESEWYLGESRMRVRHLETQLESMGQALEAAGSSGSEAERKNSKLRRRQAKELESLADSLEQTLKKLSRLQEDYDQAQWFLGEERSKITDLEAELIGLRHAQDDAAKREHSLREQLDLVSGELKAIRDFGERRQSRRFYYDDLAVELSGEADEPLFVGNPRDISGSGMRVETEQHLPSEQPLKIRFQLPGSSEKLATTAQVVWQHASIDSTKFQSGWKFLDLPEDLKEHFASYKSDGATN